MEHVQVDKEAQAAKEEIFCLKQAVKEDIARHKQDLRLQVAETDRFKEAYGVAFRDRDEAKSAVLRLQTEVKTLQDDIRDMDEKSWSLIQTIDDLRAKLRERQKQVDTGVAMLLEEQQGRQACERRIADLEAQLTDQWDWDAGQAHAAQARAAQAGRGGQVLAVVRPGAAGRPGPAPAGPRAAVITLMQQQLQLLNQMESL